jgi:hypothetical protein
MITTLRSTTTLLGAIALTAAIVTPTHAADHTNLEEGLPIEVEDAYPVHYRGLEFQSNFQFESIEGDDDRFTIEPRLEWGFAPNWQGRIALPLELSSDDDLIEGVGLEVFHNFNTEGIHTPAFALSLGADIPTIDDRGVDLSLKAIATKSIGTGNAMDRLHFNLGYTINTDPNETDRDGRVSAVLGYSRRLAPETIFVSDLAFEQEATQDEEALILEAGIRQQMTPLSVLSIGVGAGLTEESPDFRLTVGWQRSL